MAFGRRAEGDAAMLRTGSLKAGPQRSGSMRGASMRGASMRGLNQDLNGDGGDKGGQGLRKFSSSIAPKGLAGRVGRGTKNKMGSATPVVFLFDIKMEELDGCNDINSNVVLIMERGKVVFTSRVFKLEDGGAEIDEEFSKEVTLYRNQADGEMQEKLYKVALRAGHMNGQTKGKIHIDLAKYADVTGGSERRLKLKLSSGGSLVVTIASKFIKAGKRDKGADAVSASSMGSYLTSSDVGSDGPPSRDNIDDLDDLESDIEFSAKSLPGFSTGPASVALKAEPASVHVRSAAPPAAAALSATDELKKKIKLATNTVKRLEEDNERLRQQLDGSTPLRKKNEVLRRQVNNIQELLNKNIEGNMIDELKEAKVQVADETSDLEVVNWKVSQLRKDLRQEQQPRRRVWFGAAAAQ